MFVDTTTTKNCIGRPKYFKLISFKVILPGNRTILIDGFNPIFVSRPITNNGTNVTNADVGNTGLRIVRRNLVRAIGKLDNADGVKEIKVLVYRPRIGITSGFSDFRFVARNSSASIPC